MTKVFCTARSEAKRFIGRADKAIQRLKTDKYAWVGSPETGACRRASMDLTRSLAEMRKPG